VEVGRKHPKHHHHARPPRRYSVPSPRFLHTQKQTRYKAQKSQLPLKRGRTPPQPKAPSKRKLGNKKGTKEEEKLQHKNKRETQRSQKQPKDMTSPKATKISTHVTMHNDDINWEIKACNMTLIKLAKILG
jgi:hypothetical protein